MPVSPSTWMHPARLRRFLDGDPMVTSALRIFAKERDVTHGAARSEMLAMVADNMIIRVARLIPASAGSDPGARDAFPILSPRFARRRNFDSSQGTDAAGAASPTRNPGSGCCHLQSWSAQDELGRPTRSRVQPRRDRRDRVSRSGRRRKGENAARRPPAERIDQPTAGRPALAGGLPLRDRSPRSPVRDLQILAAHPGSGRIRLRPDRRLTRQPSRRPITRAV